jgi:hypothetical protein
MDIKEILKTMNTWLLSIAKSLQAGNNDEAIDLLTKQAEHLQELIEKTEETPHEDTQEPEEDIDPSDDDPGDTDPEKEPIEKTVPVQLTKAQAEWLQKFVEMYISAWDVADFVNQFEEIKNRVAQIEKQSTQLPESPQEIKKSSLDWILTVQ